MPVYHITNPPYLYLGYIVKHKETRQFLEYFQGANKGYQDLYQLALINDLRHQIEKMIYIIPANFLFGASVSNKIRKDFFQFYNIKKLLFLRKKSSSSPEPMLLSAFLKEKIVLKKKF